MINIVKNLVKYTQKEYLKITYFFKIIRKYPMILARILVILVLRKFGIFVHFSTTRLDFLILFSCK